MNTTRTIKSIKISSYGLVFDKFFRTLAICEKFGGFVSKFELEDSSVSKNNLIQILQTLPNLEFLSLKWVEGKVKGKIDLVSVVELNLNRLTELFIMGCGASIINIFNKLPQDILKDFTFCGRNKTIIMNECFQRQTKIKNLFIGAQSIKCDKLPIDNLQLRKLKLDIRFDDEHIVRNAIRHQKLLTNLDLTKNKINDETFKEVCDMCHLEDLHLRIDLITKYQLKDISKLKKITELSIISKARPAKNDLEAISTIQIPLLKKLKLVLSNNLEIKECYLTRIASNFPNLQFLSIEGLIAVETIYILLKNFNKLEVLNISNTDYIYVGIDVSSLHGEGLANYNLKELTIENFNIPLKSKLIRKLSNNFTNLEKLILFPDNNMTSNIIRKFLKRFKKLSYFEITSNCCTVSRDLLTFIEKYGANLVYIKLVGMRMDKKLLIHQLHDIYEGKLTFETANCIVRV